MALAATLAVILLSVCECYFGDVDGHFGGGSFFFSTNNALHAMQVAAKLHDITMVGSLSNIAFHLWTSHLLGINGVPLGLLTAPFKLGKPEYLISSELRQGFRKSTHLAILLFLASVLVFSLAPVSAIMLVPTLNWWLIPTPFSGGRKGSDVPVFVRASWDDLWPMTMKTTYDEECYSPVNISIYCPQAGFSEIQSWLQGYASARRTPSISMVEQLSGARRQILLQDDGILESPEIEDLKDISWDLPVKNGSNESQALDAYGSTIGMGVLATTTSHWMVAILGLFYNWARSANLGLVNTVAHPGLRISDEFRVREPLVTARCSYYDFDVSRESSDPLTAPYVHNRFGDSGIATTERFGWEIPSSSWNFSRPLLNVVNFTWVDLEHRDVNASIGAIFSIPDIPASGGGQSSMIVPCTIEARWIDSWLFYDPSTSDMVLDNVTDPSVFSRNSSKWGKKDTALTASDIVKLPLNWARMLNTETPRSTSYGPSTLMTRIIDPLINRADDYRTNRSSLATYYGESFKENHQPFGRQLTHDIASILALFVADAMSRAGYMYDIAVTYDRNATSASQLSLMKQVGIEASDSNFTWSIPDYEHYSALNTRFYLTVYRWGYGYALNSITTWLGFAILCIFMAIVVVYLVWWACASIRLRRSHPHRTVTTFRWSSIGELLALAINSPRSHDLDGTCSGIEDSKVWGIPIRIREVEPSHLGLRVGELKESDARVTATGRYGGIQPRQRS